MKKERFEILRKSYCDGALMNGDDIVYIVYIYRAHVYRFQNGRITKADDEDRRLVSEGYKEGRINVLWEREDVERELKRA